jgi:hypothetical protein
MVSEQVNWLLHAFQKGQVDFDNTLIKRADLQTQFLPFVSFRKACLPEADFRHAILPGADFSGAVLSRANFEHANLLAASLDWTNLTQANLSHVLMARSTLIGSDLSGADLVGASLSGADLSSANLRNANLAGANLKGTNLHKANLFGARIDPNALADANLDFTVMPNGDCHTRSQSPEKGSVPVANMMSYTRIAHSLSSQRTARSSLEKPLESAKQPQPPAPFQAPDVPTANPPFADRSTLQGMDTPKSPPQKHVWFRFAEQSGDLDLAIIHPEISQD